MSRLAILIVLELFGVSAFATTIATYTATKVTSGQYFQCVLFSIGRVKCWGNNQYGQLGQGNTTNIGDQANEMGTNISFIDLGSDSSGKPLVVTDVQAGIGHVCAILAGGQIKCWGNNSSGQLGYGDANIRGTTSGAMGNNLGFVSLGTGLTAKQLALGSYHSCVLLVNNQVKCWGDNSTGQLGQGNSTPIGTSANQMGDQLASVNLGTGRTVKSIAGGLAHTCAVLDNNTIKCWGYNADGELGQGTSVNMGMAAGQMGDSLPAVNLGTGVTAIAVSAGTSHTCALLATYQVKCWGDNWAGQLGQGVSAANIGTLSTEMGNNLPQVNLGSAFGAGTQPVVGLQVGFYTTCVLLITDQVKCWGENNFGELGIGIATGDYGLLPSDMGDSLPYIGFGTGMLAKSMSSQYGTTCVIMQNTNVKCWGINLDGALGLGNTTNMGGSAANMGDNLPTISLGPDASSTGATSSDSMCLSQSAALVSLGNGAVTLSGATTVQGSAVLLGTSTLSLSGSAAVTGLVVEPTASSTSLSGGSSIGSSLVFNLTSLAPQISSFASSLQALSPTVTVSGVTSTTTWVGNGGLNVIAVNGNVNLGSSSTLTINGTANDQFVVIVSGNISVSGAAQIVMTGAIPIQNVVFVVANSSAASAVVISGSGSMVGTVLAPNGGVSVSGAGVLKGAVFAGSAITLSGSGTALSSPFCPSGSGLPVFM